MIIDELKAANVKALKEHDKNARAILSVVLSKYKLMEIELNSNGKEMSDLDTTKLLNKIIKELNEELEGYKKVNNVEQVKAIEEQSELIKQYLPKMMSEKEVRNEIEKLPIKNIPSIMKHFKANFEGKVDMALVNAIAKEYK